MEDADGRKSKLAAIIASRIVSEVVRGEWRPGDVVGSETELLARFGVSRAVIREAIRLVEHQHVARMRRGPGGGLVVSEPDVAAISDAAVIYLLRVGARLDEVLDARVELEGMATQLAPSRLRETDLLALRDLVQAEKAGQAVDHRAMHSLLASITRNPALELFVDILNRVMLFYFSDRKALGAPVLDASARAHERIVDAVIAGNGDLARHRMVTHLEAEADFIRSGGRAHQALRPVAALQGSAGSKRAEALARELLGEVIAGKMPPGQLIGSEPDLVERFGVSRAVWREAVRILEHHQVAVMKRGPSGGLFVTAPSVVAVAEIVAVHLERRGTQVADLMELRTGVELTLVDRVAIARSSEPLAAVADLDFHGELAGLAGNRVLELVAAVLIRLTGFQQGVRRVRERRAEVDREVARAHAGIVEAVSVGDRELARHRLRRHLEATTAFLS